MNDTQMVVVVDLDQLCAEMAKKLPEIDCPDCCGPVYRFIEDGAALYLEELYWAHLCRCIAHKRTNR